MQRIKVHKSSDYTTINNTLTRDPRVSLKARGLFLTVMSLPDSWDFTISGLVSIIPEGKAAVYSAINELISLGYCTRKFTHDGIKRTGADYSFFERPLNTENLITENQDLGNRPQLSKYLIKYLMNSIYKGKNVKNLDLVDHYEKMIDHLNEDQMYLNELFKINMAAESIIHSVMDENIKIGLTEKYSVLKKHIYHKAKKTESEIKDNIKMLI